MFDKFSAIVTVIIIFGYGAWMFFYTRHYLTFFITAAKRNYERNKHLPLIGKVAKVQVTIQQGKFYKVNFWLIKIFGMIIMLSILYLLYRIAFLRH